MMIFRLNDRDFLNLPEKLKNDLNLSVIEGGFATAMGTLIGGAFLIGFALQLGADNLTTGILVSLPLLANLTQVIGSYIINQVGDTKKVCILSVILHRIAWLLIIIAPVFLLQVNMLDLRIWVFVMLLGVASVFASISSISWNSWMADLVPRGLRGRFFAYRNMISQIAGMIIAVLAGWFIDYWLKFSPDSIFQSYGFIILFSIAILFGIISIILLKKISRSDRKIERKPNFFKKLKLPFKDSNFSRFILFTSCWGFVVGIVGPFFNVHMIKTLDIPFVMITFFAVISGIMGIIGLSFWGKFIDRFGAKTLLLFCSFGASLVPFFWIFTYPGNYSIIWFAEIISGFFWSGVGLASGTLMMNLAPGEENTVYFAVFSAVAGISGALAPIFGGFLSELFLKVNLLGLSGIKLLFLTSTLLRFSSISLIRTFEVKDSESIEDIFEKFNSWQRMIPIYNFNRFSIFNHNYRSNIVFSMSRGILKLAVKAEKKLKKLK